MSASRRERERTGGGTEPSNAGLGPQGTGGIFILSKAKTSGGKQTAFIFFYDRINRT